MAKRRYLVTIIRDFISGDYDYALDENGSNRDQFDHNLYMVVNGRGFKIRPESCESNEVSYLGTNRVESIPLHKIPVHQPSPSTSIVTNWFEYNGPTHDAEGKNLDTAQLLVWKYTINGAFVPDFVFKEVRLKRLTH